MNPPFFSVFVAALALPLACASLAGAADISGVVQREGGKPIEGATVRVYAASLRTGSSPMCSTCWLDCQKSARTGPDGRYQIAGVSDDLIFDLLVLADGHAPTFVEDIDPAKASPPAAVLKARDVASIPPNRLSQGRVVGPDGHPIAGARIKSVASQGVDRMALTDADGRFVLVWSKQAQKNWLRISAEGWGSAQAVAEVKRGVPQPLVVKLSRGVTIMGRVVDKQGRPAPHVKIGAIQTERSFIKDLPVVEAETGEDGSFFLFNVPAQDELAVYGLMESLAGRGAVPVRVIQTGRDEETVQTPDFVIQRSCKLSGQFLLPNGEKFPAETRVNVGRSVAWDSQIIAVSPDGRFEVDGLPPGEIIEVVPPRDVPDRYAQSATHSFNIDVLNPCVGRVMAEDVKDLKIEMVAKDSKARQEEVRRDVHRKRHAEYLQEVSLSPEKEQIILTALVQQEDDEMKWQQDAKPDPEATRLAAAAAFEKQVRSVLGDEVFQKFAEMEYLQTGKSWVTNYRDGRKGETLTAPEKAALARSIGRHMDQFYKSDAVDPKQTLSKEARHQWHNRQYDILLTAGAEVLPPAKLAFFREWVEQERSVRWEQIQEAYARQ